MTTNRTSVASHFGRRDEKFYKATLFESSRMLLGVNCLEPGQSQAVHDHPNQDKFYLVQEGRGQFTVGSESLEATVGDVIWAPAGVRHGVTNTSTSRLSLVVGIAPGPTP